MSKRIPQKKLISIACCLLVTSFPVLADRPAMSERSEPFEAEMIDIPTELESMPVFENEPAQENGSAMDMENRPSMETTTEMESRPAMETATEMEDTPPAEEANMQQDTYESTAPVEASANTTERKVTGDVLELQPGETLPIIILDFPKRGMTMDKVKNELGEALSVSDSVGDPPITTWTYADRVIYFEHTHVIHVVAIH